MAIFINEQTVTELLNMDTALVLVEEAFSLYNSGKAFNTVRTRARIRKGALHILPAAMPTYGVMGYKAYTSFREGVRFLFYLHSAENGELLAVIEASELGRLRTGAASGVATKYLAPKSADICVVFGAGYQAETQLQAVHAVRPLSKVFIMNRKPEKGADFAEKMQKMLGCEVVVPSNAAEALASADIITTITTANTPLFDKTQPLKKGVHINAAGSNSLVRMEIPEYLVETSVVTVDSKEVAEKECGDILPSLEKGRIHWNEILEIGEIINGRAVDTSTSTIFESQGMGLQDLICANHVYKKALELNIGEKLPF